MNTADMEPRRAPIGQAQVRLGTSEGKAERVQELRAQADYIHPTDPAEAARLRAEADRYDTNKG